MAETLNTIGSPTSTTAVLPTCSRALVTDNPAVICGGWLVGIIAFKTACTTCVAVFILALSSVAITVIVLVPEFNVNAADQLVPATDAARSH